MLKQRFGKKGFTMAELLIVIAIIAILVAIALPVFGAQLNKAKHAVDVANVRSIYSELVAEELLSEDISAATGTADKVTITLDVSKYTTATANEKALLSSGCTVTFTAGTDGAPGKLTVSSFGRNTTFTIDSDVGVTIPSAS